MVAIKLPISTKGAIMFYPITKEKIRENIRDKIIEQEAELEALKNVKININHKVLTNRAIDGATVFDYIGINKAIRVPYIVKWSKGENSGVKYMSREITAYSYHSEDGTEIGSSGCIRISRTITPKELKVVVDDIIESMAGHIGDLRSEYRRADSIAKKRNKLVEQINKFNDSISYASEARIK